MKLKGINKFREKIPYFKGKKTVMLPIFFISVFIACSLFLFSFYLIPEFFPANEIIYYLKPFFPVIGDFITGCIGLLLVYQLWARRDKLKKKYGQLSYQKIFLVGFGGIIIMFCIVFQALFPFYYWIPSYWTDLPSIIFTLSFSSLIPFVGSLIYLICFIIGIIIIIIGLLMVYRAIITFGIDYMAVVYLYFPEESEIQNHKIYSVLRHPTYSALITLCLGGIFIYLNIYSLFFFAIFLLVMFIHVYFVEEKELISRFGDSYMDFRKQVPAFFVRPKNFLLFLKITIIGRE